MVKTKYGIIRAKVLFVGDTKNTTAIGRFSNFGKDGVFSVLTNYKMIKTKKPVFKTPFKSTTKDYNKENVLKFLKKQFGLNFDNFTFNK